MHFRDLFGLYGKGYTLFGSLYWGPRYCSNQPHPCVGLFVGQPVLSGDAKPATHTKHKERASRCVNST